MIAITGVGLVSCLGNNTAQSFYNFQKGICGVREIERFSTQKYHLKNAYEIPNELYEEGIKSWIISAIDEALKESHEYIDDSTIIIVGTGLRNLRKFEESIVYGTPLSLAQIDFKDLLIRKYPYVKDIISITNACSSSLYALSLGCDFLNLSLADKVIVVGADCISQTMHGLDERVSISCPAIIKSFDKQRKGVLLGEGAAAIIIKRNVFTDESIYIKSISLSCDAYHETQPCTNMIENTIKNAISQACLLPEDIDMIFTHGTGTILNDIAEGTALNHIFKNSKKTLITGLKPMIGHTSGASGLMSIIAGYMCLKHHRTIPLINMDQAIDEVKDLHFVQKSTSEKLTKIQINAFGFGGLNAVAIIGK